MSLSSYASPLRQYGVARAMWSPPVAFWIDRAPSQGKTSHVRFGMRSLLGLLALACLGSVWLSAKYRAHLRNRDRVVPTAFDIATGQNVQWAARVGRQTYSTPVVSNGRVFVYCDAAEDTASEHPGVGYADSMLCLDAANGHVLWRSVDEVRSEKEHGRPRAISNTPYVEGERLWYVTNECEVVCLDTEGFYDNQDDGVSTASEFRLGATGFPPMAASPNEGFAASED